MHEEYGYSRASDLGRSYNWPLPRTLNPADLGSSPRRPTNFAVRADHPKLGYAVAPWTVENGIVAQRQSTGLLIHWPRFRNSPVPPNFRLVAQVGRAANS